MRLKTPKLPEPTGPRRGQQGSQTQGPRQRLLILGDSAAAGVGVDTQSQALSGHLITALGATSQLDWQLEATTGHTTSDTLARLSGIAGPFDTVVVSLGVNDTVRFTPAHRFRALQQRLIAALRDRGAQTILLSGVPPMQHMRALPNPLAWALGQHAARLDRVLADLARTEADVLHLPFDMPLEPHLLARDGYHPGPEAYPLWANQIAAKLSPRASAGSAE